VSEPRDPSYKGPPSTHQTAPLTHDHAPSSSALQVAEVAAVLPEVSLDRYQLRDEFARGGLGRISRAHDQHLRRTVAVKQLLAGNADAARRFIREALITARLQHPAIVPIYEAGRWPSGEPFYAMKLVSGRSLDQVIRARKTLAERLALLPNLIAVAEAMAYAHSQRIIHRDLKPANVLVGSFGETVLIDWGLAKDLSAVGATGADAMPFGDETEIGTVLGTPTYMPPEQAEGKVVDERADVYALGAVLYHVLCGAPPYGGSSSAETLARVLAEPAPPLLVREPGVPRDLATVVDKAMAREPAARYPTAKELAEDLVRFQAGQLVSAHRYSPVEMLRRWVQRRRAPVSVAVALLTAAAMVVVLMVSRIAHERDAARRELGEARAATAAAETRAAALVLATARAQLSSDARAALATLAHYRGDERQQAQSIAADARSQLAPSPLTPSTPAPEVRRLLGGEVRSPDGTRRAVATRDEILVEELSGGRPLRLGGGAHEVAFSPDGRFLTDGARLWDWAAGSARAFASKPAAHVAFSPSGDRLATTGLDGVLTLWTLPDARAQRLGHGERVAFSPDGATLASSDADGTVRLWHVSDGSGRTLVGHRGAVAALAFSPDGRLLASGGNDGTLRLWQTASGDGWVARAGNAVRAVAWTRDEVFVATADGATRSIRVDDVPLR
jgi:hypothetical protein